MFLNMGTLSVKHGYIMSLKFLVHHVRNMSTLYFKGWIHYVLNMGTLCLKNFENIMFET